ncbi:septal ring lytic transglycosylase RlpA family protein [Flammeovirgaceae bacterium SG7u.111]|nr:septal ring lytic transglycosylase RlpA family protein [Flammeovirgaceae bacterium SG7u.132]WPO37336.1 septal ring lytic transglycosylase RlpA family protein [Flammeovirgaceae bacterium SG7u.111]
MTSTITLFNRAFVRGILSIMLLVAIQSCEILDEISPEEETEIEEPTGNFVQSGIASYYADKFEGRSTASGEIFKQDLLTAAHKDLPFGTEVKVTNLKNGKSITVKINDRGPFVTGRIIDLSKAGAEALDYINDGLADVRIECELPQSVADELNEKLGLTP